MTVNYGHLKYDHTMSGAKSCEGESVVLRGNGENRTLIISRDVELSYMERRRKSNCTRKIFSN